MKKRMIALAGIAAVCGMLTLHASASEELLTNMKEASASTENSQAVFNMDLDASMGITGDGMDMDMQIQCDLNGDVETTWDPFGMHALYNIHVNAVGQEQDQSMEMYVVEEDDALRTYNGNNGTWTMEESSFDDSDRETLEQVRTFMTGLDYFSILDEAGISLDESQDTDGSYVLTASWDATQLLPVVEILSAKMDEFGEEITGEAGNILEQAQALTQQASEYEDYLRAVRIDLTATVDPDTYLVRSVTIDLSGTDLLAFKELISAAMGMDEGYEVAFDLSTAVISIDMAYDDVQITVPDDVKEAAQSAGSEDDYEEPEVRYSEDPAFSGITKGSEADPASVGEPFIGYFWDYDFETDKSSYVQGLYTITGIESGEAAQAAFDKLTEAGYVYDDLDMDLCEPRLVNYEVTIPSDLPENEYGYKAGLSGVSVVTPGKGYLDYGEDGYYYVHTFETDYDFKLQPGETGESSLLIIIPKDLTEGFQLESYNGDGFYVNF